MVLRNALGAIALDVTVGAGNTLLTAIRDAVQGVLSTKPQTVTVTGTTAALNGAIDGTTDLTGYTAVRVQMTGTYNATTLFEVSNDGITWVSTYLFNASSNGPTNQGGLSGTYAGPTVGRYFRIRASAYTSGTVGATIIYSAGTPPVVPPTSMALNSGSGLIGGVHIGSGATPTSLGVTSTASTNAGVAKASGGQLGAVTISNPSAATIYFKLYNKATAPTVGTDTPTAIIPVAATSTVTHSWPPNGLRFNAGIAYAITAGMAATDTAAIAAGVLVHGTLV